MQCLFSARWAILALKYPKISLVKSFRSPLLTAKLAPDQTLTPIGVFGVYHRKGKHAEV
jgi:hypothetical protein